MEKDELEKFRNELPDDVEELKRLGEEYFEHDEEEKAKECFEEILKLVSQSDFHIETLSIQTSIEKKIESLRKVIELNPNNGCILLDIGRIYFEQGKFEEAIKYVNKALKLYSNIESAFLKIKEIYIKQGKFEETIELNPSNIKILHMLEENYSQISDFCFEQGMYEIAIECSRKIIDTLKTREEIEKNVLL
ncbi:MAG: tetratricopeptide repeat protein [Leptospiraceae bacterium]|nr:tetratricopeptide repeat protein [Leptospiraceae bacterium]MCP5493992.1 tetratricopeptide repeat protein [Leptospiraceae bacterium]